MKRIHKIEDDRSSNLTANMSQVRKLKSFQKLANIAKTSMKIGVGTKSHHALRITKIWFKLELKNHSPSSKAKQRQEPWLFFSFN